MGGMGGYFMTNPVSISDCYVKGSVKGNDYGGKKCNGGIIGSSYTATDTAKLINCYYDGTIGEWANPLVGYSNGDDNTGEVLKAEQFVNCSWNSELPDSQDIIGYQGGTQVEGLTRSDKCPFTSGMSYEEFLKAVTKE